MKRAAPTFPAAHAAALCAERKWRRRPGPRVDESLKLAIFLTNSGRHLAIDLERKQSIHLWAEAVPHEMEGMEIRNRQNPGQPYAENQARHSGLRSSPLAIGNRAWYVRFKDEHAAARFIAWYETA